MPNRAVESGNLARQLSYAATRAGLRVAVAESLTGGLLAAALVEPAGSSASFRGGVVAYATDLKHQLLGVDLALLQEHGAVHPDVAQAMARGVRDNLAADIGIATTGIAGPATDGAPVGRVYIACTSPYDEKVLIRCYDLLGSRLNVRNATVKLACALGLGVIREQN